MLGNRGGRRTHGWHLRGEARLGMQLRIVQLPRQNLHARECRLNSGDNVGRHPGGSCWGSVRGWTFRYGVPLLYLAVCAFTVIPRSRSTFNLSSTCWFAPVELGVIVPVSCDGYMNTGLGHSLNYTCLQQAVCKTEAALSIRHPIKHND